MRKEPYLTVNEISRKLITLRKTLINNQWVEEDEIELIDWTIGQVRSKLQLRSRSRKGLICKSPKR